MSGLREASTSQLLADIADGDHADDVTFDELLQRFRRRAFGVLILVATLPAFLPLPAGAGAISGPLVSLFGAQMMLGQRQPWIPHRWRNRGIRRQRFLAFNRRMRPWLLRVEKLARPRWKVLISSVSGNAFSGLLLLILGILLALPLPLTNYPFGLLILLYAMALIERDGILLSVAWLIGLGAITAVALLSNEAAELVSRLWH